MARRGLQGVLPRSDALPPVPAPRTPGSPARLLLAARDRLPGPRRLALPVALAAASLVLLALLADDHDRFDLQVYSGAVRSWVSGVPLYDYLRPGTPYGFTYPPFTALLMLPLAVLPLSVAWYVDLAVDAAVISATTWWLLRPVAPLYGWSAGYATACAVPLVCLLEPVRDTVGFGQVNLALVALVVLDVEALRRGSRWAGVGTGLAAAVKLTPAVFVVVLVAAHPRAAVNAAAAAALATLAALVVAPSASVEYWTHALFQTSRVGRTDLSANQAVSGVLARLADAPAAPVLPWLALAGVVGTVGVVRAVRAVRAGDVVAGLALAGLTGSLVSPITWTHHLWWVVPALAVLLRAGARDRRWLWCAGGVLLLFASSLPDLVRTRLGEHLAHGPFVVLGESSYAVACLALLVLLPVAGTAVARGPVPAGVPAG